MRRTFSNGRNEMIDVLIQTGKDLVDRHLAWGNAGNMSIRLDCGRCLITASGTRLGELNETSFATCFLDESRSPEGGKPSKEWPMHKAVYEERSEVGAVLHAAPFYSTFAACSRNFEIRSDLFVETMYYLERVERVPYRHPGSAALADEVRKKARKANILLLENHGVLVFDETVNEARNAMEVLELACRMVVTGKQSELDFNPLDDRTVESFLNDSGYKKRREWPQ
ncbi:MAG TPA: class II aldolase/adducin family protein [Bacillales bacterium]|nr:class II aldolase/adducin family protein [Bacillales bacterium]